MNNKTKVTLSNGELALATDKEFILTKRRVIETSIALFTSLTPIIENIFATSILILPELSNALPKITKGENYKLLPYTILDYPAFFSKENIFAVRTMFWWSNYISVQLHLSGKYKKLFEESIFRNIKTTTDIYICINEKEWEHHFKPDNYISIHKILPPYIENIKQREFMKVALKYELHHWNMMQFHLPEGYNILNKLLS